MDAKFQPSFIPKQPIASAQQATPSRISILYVIAVVVFVITIGLVVAELIAERVLNQDITTLNQNLIDAKSSFELSTIEMLKSFSGKTKLANTLVNQHVALSKFLEALQQSTYLNVSFGAFNAKVTDAKSPVIITLQGTAASYNSLILQSEEFSNLPFLVNPTFSNFALNKNGTVSFDFAASVDPTLVNYGRYITQTP